MKTTLLKFLGLPVVLALLLTGCGLDDPDHPTGLQAPPVFSTYVAIGNSLTAGYMDSGLMMAGQAASYPQLIAGRLGFTTRDGFSQPTVLPPGIGSTPTGDPLIIAGVLRFDGSGLTPLGTTAAAEVRTLLPAIAQPTPYHNLGVPGATLGDMFSAVSAAQSESHSPFFDFINRVPFYGNEERTATVLDLDGATPKQVTYQTASVGWQAIAKGPTLLTVWAGNNDVLGGATGGDPTGAMTPASTFAQRYSDMMQLLAGGLVQRTGFPATIVVANIPNVTDIPYFIDEATFNAASGGGWPWGYAEGSAQLLTFPVLSWIANAANQGSPIPSTYTLTAAEVTLVGQHVAGYNQAIAGTVAAINASGMATVGLADVNQVLGDLTAAQKTHFLLLLPQVGNDIATAAATTAFSLDGVHPNNHGYAIVANAFIDAINATADTDLAPVDPADYTWDPTYGVPVVGKAAGAPRLSPEAAAAMAAVWR